MESLKIMSVLLSNTVLWVICACSVVQSCLTFLQPHDTVARLLSSWDFLGKNTKVGCHSLL